jgi:hypothetical protein
VGAGGVVGDWCEMVKTATNGRGFMQRSR